MGTSWHCPAVVELGGEVVRLPLGGRVLLAFYSQALGLPRHFLMELIVMRVGHLSLLPLCYSKFRIPCSSRSRKRRRSLGESRLNQSPRLECEVRNRLAW